MRLDEPRLGRDFFQIIVDGVEPFDMTHLQEAIVLLSQLDQFGGLRGAVGHGLLDKEMFAFQQGRFSEIEMRRCRCDDADGVTGLSGFLDRAKCTHAIFFGEPSGGVVSNIIETNEICLLRLMQFGINPHVFLAQRAGANDADLYFVAVGGVISGCHFFHTAIDA